MCTHFLINFILHFTIFVLSIWQLYISINNFVKYTASEKYYKIMIGIIAQALKLYKTICLDHSETNRRSCVTLVELVMIEMPALLHWGKNPQKVRWYFLNVFGQRKYQQQRFIVNCVLYTVPALWYFNDGKTNIHDVDDLNC